MEKITFCIPSKNNLRYLKDSIRSIQINGSIEHDIIVFVDKSDDGTEEWLIENNITYIKNDTDIPKGIAFGYNRCIEAAETNIVCMFHADMYMGKGFDVAINKYIKPNTVVSCTRIEPSLHPPGKEKIIKDFGLYPEDFDASSFNTYVEQLVQTYANKVTRGIFAPWSIYKKDIMSILLHDEQLHSYYEDSDMFNRFILNGYDIIQTWEGFAYHLTCRGGQFQDGVESITTDTQFHDMKAKSYKNYLRKWGSWIKNDEYQYPIIPHKYNIHCIIHNCNHQLLQLLEPWFSCTYTKNTYGYNWADYRDMEQANTLFDMNERVAEFEPSTFNMDNTDILVEFDAKRFTQQTFNIIQNLSDIITDSGEIGEFDLDCLKITITNLNTYENNLIVNTRHNI